MDNMPNVNIYIEISIKSPNTRKGTGLYVIEYGLKKTGGKATCHGILMKEKTTMESLVAQTLLAALSRLVKPCSNRVITPYAGIFNQRINELQKWKENGWNTAKGATPKNLEEWMQINAAMQTHKITFHQSPNDGKENEWKEWMQFIAKKSMDECQKEKIYYPVDKNEITIEHIEGGYLMTWRGIEPEE